MKYGKDIESYYEAYEQLKDTPGFKPPAAIAEKPILEWWDSYYLDAFYLLSSSRSIGMSEGYIPISEILAYGKHLGEEDMDKFIKIIRACDGAYLAYRHKESDKTGK